MLRVTNVSKKTISIGGITIRPTTSYVFPDNTSEYIKTRINSLSILGIVKVSAVQPVPNNNVEVIDENTETKIETTPKKSNKKSNK